MSSQDIARPAKPIDESRSLTIPQFCLLENISTYTYYRIRKQGLTPRELRIPGTDIARITPEARREWHESMRTREVQEQVKREFERRAALISEAAKKAAASPLHAKQTPPKKRGRPRKHPK
jgi:hypothetical protein